MTMTEPGTLDEHGGEPERAEEPNRKNLLGMSCGFVSFVAIAAVLAFALLAFGQLPAALIVLLIVPMVWALEWLTQKAEARSR